MTPGSSSVRARDLARHYKMGASTVCAVDGVSLEVADGDFVALLGASGSGKSSLLNLIAGLDRPTGGSIEVMGRDLAQLSRNELAHYRLRTAGMVFQSFNLVPGMTVLENVELPMRFAEVDRSKRQELARQALERVGLGARIAHRPVEMSGGEQQRASIARALINHPKLLLADEPTGNLDSRTGAEIMSLILECAASAGMTVIMVTHERALAEKYARRLLFMGDGKVMEDRRNEPGIGGRA